MQFAATQRMFEDVPGHAVFRRTAGIEELQLAPDRFSGVEFESDERRGRERVERSGHFVNPYVIAAD
jgi:hypothetical protein